MTGLTFLHFFGPFLLVLRRKKKEKTWVDRSLIGDQITPVFFPAINAGGREINIGNENERNVRFPIFLKGISLPLLSFVSIGNRERRREKRRGKTAPNARFSGPSFSLASGP
jgi:hypothetical protein